MKTFITALLMLTILTISCNTNTQAPVITERASGSTEPVVNSELIKLEAELIKLEAELQKLKEENAKAEAELKAELEDIEWQSVDKRSMGDVVAVSPAPEAVNHSCRVYEENNFRTEFTCLYFEKEFSYDEYVKQANSVNDCDGFYSDIKNKNDSICKKYQCSEEELKERCVELFSYEDDTINNKDKCIEQKCNRNKFISRCDDYEDLCTYGVILGCLNKSGLAPTDFNIAACVDSNKTFIQRECTIEACITDEVNTCADNKCKLKPTKEYLKQCKIREKDTCTTQIRTSLF